MSALLALAVLQAATPALCDGGLCDAEQLAPFLEKLARARGGAQPVRILQLGDSHTAGDQVTGTWRTLLQSRHGSAGRGVLPPGRPYQGYLTRGITARQSDGWQVDGLFGPAWHGAAGAPLGLSGYSLTATRAGATMSLHADPAELFDRLTVCALRGPGAGTLALTVGTTSVTWSLSDAIPMPACTSVDVDAPGADASVAVVAGPATITSWRTERRGAGGVALSNLGTVGAQLVHLDRADSAIVARELEEYAPDLIVVAFGTNEAFRPGFAAAWYDAALQAGIRRLQRLAPGVPMLLLGAPDSATRLASLQVGEGGVSPACAAADAGWRPTAALATVQAIARRRAHELGVAYWDWSGRMGGRCTADAWVRQVPALMRGDYVHFTTPGAAIVAGLLQRDLDAAAARLVPAADGGHR